MVDTAISSSIPASRSSLRRARRALSLSQQRKHALLLGQNLKRLLTPKRHGRIALYWPVDGEIDPTLWFRKNPSGWQVFLPVLMPVGPMQFSPWIPHERLKTNRFKIPEPRGAVFSARQLDWVILPLTGFNSEGFRQGMGGGFYDYCLQQRRFSSYWKRPKLIGVAHELQQTRFIPNPWDIQPDWIVTESRILKAKTTG